MKGRPKTKNNKEIAQEWDNIAHVRAMQLRNHEDLSMDNVLIPYILEMISDADLSNVLDIGCGTGYTTCKIAEKTKNITGIDISEKSITEAKENSHLIDFIKSSIEDFSKESSNKFSLAIANMTYMDVADLEKAIESSSNLLQEDAFLPPGKSMGDF